MNDVSIEHMKYFDAHSHVNFKDYDTDRDAVLARMAADEIGTLTVGVDLESSRDSIAFVEGKDGFYASIGLHPNYTAQSHMAEKGETFNVSEFEKLVTHPKVVAIGECGLDYFRMEGDIEVGTQAQMQEFVSQMEFAIRHDKPLMIHCRPTKGSMDAYEDLLTILESRAHLVGSMLRGNIHFFVGTPEVAKRFYEIGFTTSFTGVITFAHDYDETVRQAPLDMILTETDAPYAAPNPHRGERNEPGYVKHVVARIAELKNLPEAEVANAVITNAQRLFRL